MEILFAVIVLFVAYKIFFGKNTKKRTHDAIIGASARLGVPSSDTTRILDNEMEHLSQLLAATALPASIIKNLPVHERMAHCIKILYDKEKRAAVNSASSQPAKKNSRFYIRGTNGEHLTTPIHIHFDSFKTIFESNGNVNSGVNNLIRSRGTFLVTISSPNFSIKGITARVSGVNHRNSNRGVVDGVIAHVEMARDLDDGPVERVYVSLHEDGRISGVINNDGDYKEVDLNEVYFSHGDTVYLDCNGEPFDEDHKPQPTLRQQQFSQQEIDRIGSSILKR